jgi:hypothetical protein
LIELKHYEEKNLYTVVYKGPVNLDEYKDLILKAEALLSNLPTGKKMVNITNLKNGKVVNKDVVLAMADFTKRNAASFEKIHIVGMSAFMKILYRTFLAIVGKDNPTVVEERNFEDVCASYGVDV